MPLRDHFRPPLDDVHSWEGFHCGWPAVIVQHLRKTLPAGYIAGPRINAGSHVIIDMAADENNGGVSSALWAPPQPSVAVETRLPDNDEYEVRIYDARRGRRLVAAVEIVSPANKDRPEHRNIFVAKCAVLLQKGVAVSIVDLVTIRHFNLYAELLAFIGHSDPTLGAEPPNLYAASCRWVEKDTKKLLQAWSHVLTGPRAQSTTCPT